VAGLNEELRFLDYLVCGFGGSWVSCVFVRAEKVLCEIAADKRIKEELSIEEVSPELRDDAVGIRAMTDESPVEQ
jgi:hypothetical protein